MPVGFREIISLSAIVALVGCCEPDPPAPTSDQSTLAEASGVEVEEMAQRLPRGLPWAIRENAILENMRNSRTGLAESSHGEFRALESAESSMAQSTLRDLNAKLPSALSVALSDISSSAQSESQRSQRQAVDDLGWVFLNALHDSGRLREFAGSVRNYREQILLKKTTLPRAAWADIPVNCLTALKDAEKLVEFIPPLDNASLPAVTPDALGLLKDAPTAKEAARISLLHTIGAGVLADCLARELQRLNEEKPQSGRVSVALTAAYCHYLLFELQHDEQWFWRNVGPGFQKVKYELSVQARDLAISGPSDVSRKTTSLLSTIQSSTGDQLPREAICLAVLRSLQELGGSRIRQRLLALSDKLVDLDGSEPEWAQARRSLNRVASIANSCKTEYGDAIQLTNVLFESADNPLASLASISELEVVRLADRVERRDRAVTAKLDMVELQLLRKLSSGIATGQGIGPVVSTALQQLGLYMPETALVNELRELLSLAECQGSSDLEAIRQELLRAGELPNTISDATPDQLKTLIATRFSAATQRVTTHLQTRTEKLANLSRVVLADAALSAGRIAEAAGVDNIESVLRQSPGLKNRLKQSCDIAYRHAATRLVAQDELSAERLTALRIGDAVSALRSAKPRSVFVGALQSLLADPAILAASLGTRGELDLDAGTRKVVEEQLMRALGASNEIGLDKRLAELLARGGVRGVEGRDVSAVRQTMVNLAARTSKGQALALSNQEQIALATTALRIANRNTFYRDKIRPYSSPLNAQVTLLAKAGIITPVAASRCYESLDQGVMIAMAAKSGDIGSAIAAGEGLLNRWFGDGEPAPPPEAQMHQQVMEGLNRIGVQLSAISAKLDVMDAKLDAILAGQERIIQGICLLAENDARILEGLSRLETRQFDIERKIDELSRQSALRHEEVMRGVGYIIESLEDLKSIQLAPALVRLRLVEELQGSSSTAENLPECVARLNSQAGSLRTVQEEVIPLVERFVIDPLNNPSGWPVEVKLSSYKAPETIGRLRRSLELTGNFLATRDPTFGAWWSERTPAVCEPLHAVILNRDAKCLVFAAPIYVLEVNGRLLDAKGLAQAENRLSVESRCGKVLERLGGALELLDIAIAQHRLLYGFPEYSDQYLAEALTSYDLSAIKLVEHRLFGEKRVNQDGSEQRSAPGPEACLFLSSLRPSVYGAALEKDLVKGQLVFRLYANRSDKQRGAVLRQQELDLSGAPLASAAEIDLGALIETRQLLARLVSDLLAARKIATR